MLQQIGAGGFAELVLGVGLGIVIVRVHLAIKP
jgi:hypothetical protein